MSSFADKEFGTFVAVNHIHDAVCLAVELLVDDHLRCRAMGVAGGTDKEASLTFCLAARSSSWHAG